MFLSPRDASRYRCSVNQYRLFKSTTIRELMHPCMVRVKMVFFCFITMWCQFFKSSWLYALIPQDLTLNLHTNVLIFTGVVVNYFLRNTRVDVTTKIRENTESLGELDRANNLICSNNLCHCTLRIFSFRAHQTNFLINLIFFKWMTLNHVDLFDLLSFDLLSFDLLSFDLLSFDFFTSV